MVCVLSVAVPAGNGPTGTAWDTPAFTSAASGEAGILRLRDDDGVLLAVAGEAAALGVSCVPVPQSSSRARFLCSCSESYPASSPSEPSLSEPSTRAGCAVADWRSVLTSSCNARMRAFLVLSTSANARYRSSIADRSLVSSLAARWAPSSSFFNCSTAVPRSSRALSSWVACWYKTERMEQMMGPGGLTG